MIKLGLNIPNFGPTTAPAGLLGWARFAQSHGFALAMVSDHVAPTPDVTAIYPSPFYDPFMTLGWLAGQTDGLELGTTVTILPYRHPLLTARLGTNLDQFSGGRFVFGVGVGWSEREYAALGIPFRQRGRIADEFLGAITAAWTNDCVSLDGRHASYAEVDTGPRPVQSPHPPIWVGGNSTAGIRRAARYGDAWHPVNPDPAWLEGVAIPQLRAAADALGRPMPAITPRIKAHPVGDEVTSPSRPLGFGSIAQIRSDLERLEAMGCPYVVLDTNPDDPSDRQPADDDWRSLRQIAAAVQHLTA